MISLSNRAFGLVAVLLNRRVVVILWTVSIAGWFVNVIQLANHWRDSWYGINPMRALGVLVFPLGAVLGFV